MAEANEADRERLIRASGTLRAFVQLFEAITSTAAEEQRADACREAAVHMAVLREHEHPEIAAAALLWQSFALELGGRRDRALAALPEALADPNRISFSYLSRLLRCRLLADGEQYSAALTLTIRIRQRCDDWFKSGEPKPAKRLAALLQARITHRWVEQLETRQPLAAERLTASLDELRTELFDPGGGPVYHLDRLIPRLVEAPKIRLPAGARKIDDHGGERTDPRKNGESTPDPQANPPTSSGPATASAPS
jgi:hypothetical protein